MAHPMDLSCSTFLMMLLKFNALMEASFLSAAIVLWWLLWLSPRSHCWSIQLIYQPWCCPHLNTCEYCFHQLKGLQNSGSCKILVKFHRSRSLIFWQWFASPSIQFLYKVILESSRLARLRDWRSWFVNLFYKWHLLDTWYWISI